MKDDKKKPNSKFTKKDIELLENIERNVVEILRMLRGDRNEQKD